LKIELQVPVRGIPRRYELLAKRCRCSFGGAEARFNARRGVARSVRIRCNGPSSREDRCTPAMRVVGSGKAADVLGTHAPAPNPGVGVLLWVFGFTLRRLVWRNVADAAAGAVAPVPGCRQ